MRSARLTRWLVYAMTLLAPLLAPAQTDQVQGSLHDLSVNGPGQVKAVSSTAVCLFCHASHLPATQTARPLWNQQLSTVPVYNLYTSSTFKQTNTQLSTRSKLCLSCHDGTVAIGQTYAGSGRIAVQGALPPAATFGSDLSRDHPFGFTMPAIDDGEIKLSLAASPPSTSDPAVKLFDNKIECVTCHDPHTPNRDPSVQFLVRSNRGSALCMSCHDATRGALAGWPSSQHAIAMNVVSGGAKLPYATVAENACVSCHSGHNSPGTGARLLRAGQNTCDQCHGSLANLSPPAANVSAQVNSAYAHPIGVPASTPHDPAEPLPVSNSRHSECADCHNPHAAQATTATAVAPMVEPSLLGVSGISASGSVVNPATNQYEICFKCHGDSNNKPQSATYGVYGREPVRAVWSTDPYNLRLDFDSPVARHNVTQPARTGVSPSLRDTMLDLNGNPTGRSLVSSAYIYCTDCHNSDAARASGGTAPNGPHGSKWMHLLERQYQLNVLPGQGPGSQFAGIAYSPGVNSPYALCDKCHDLDNKLNLSGTGSDTVFGKHRLHVVSEGASCSVCHSAHGVQGGSMVNNRHLVNFDTQIVGPSAGNLQPYIDTSRRMCFLTCHGEAHNGMSY